MSPGERGITLPRPDYFLAHRPTQPKREVADYVESQGILVPQRFAGLPEALASGRPFIVRSEHPQDYDGASGVFVSLVVSPQRTVTAEKDLVPSEIDQTFKPGHDYREFARLVLGVNQLRQGELETELTKISLSNVNPYCKYLGIPVEEFLQQVSYSYWELIPGVNRAVVADSAIKGRYHVSTAIDGAQHDSSKSNQRNNYLIVENGEIVRGNPQDLPEDSPEGITALIQAYEKVRNLERFSPDNCPIIEFQSNGTDQHFLQYLKGRDFDPATFVLEREPEQDEISPVLARGATPEDGVEIDVTFLLYHPRLGLPEATASLIYFNDPMLIEVMVRGSKVQIVKTDNPSNFFIADQGHQPRSLLFKPEISLVLSYREVDSILNARGFRAVDDEPGKNKFRVKIVSDGRKAYLKRIG